MIAEQQLDPRSAEAPQNAHFATFRVAGLFMGIALTRVQELMKGQEMASVPLAPDAVCGLINLRGQIVTALDMRCILGLPGVAADRSPPMNIVVRSDGETVSLLVDEICDVLEVQAHAEMPIPENLPASQKALLEAVYQQPSGLLLILNPDQVIAAATC